MTDEERLERKRAQARAYAAAHRDESRAYYQANKEKKCAYQRARTAAYPGKRRQYLAKRAEHVRAVSRAWYLAHREDQRARNRAWHLAHREERRLKDQARREKTKAKRQKQWRTWAQANVGRINAKTAKRKTAQRRATPPWADLVAIEAVYIRAAQRAHETGTPHDVDHIYPLRGAGVCGLHVAWNLQILTRLENQRKKNTDPTEHARRCA